MDPKQGRQAVTTTARPITQIGSRSSVNTTFTAKTVTDASAWDLSNVAQGFVITTSDGYRAKITGVDNANNTLTCESGWADAGGRSGRGLAVNMPAAGARVTVHKMEACGKLLVDALDTNSGAVFLGFDSSVSSDPSSPNVGHEIAASPTQPNHRLIVDPTAKDELDLTQVFVICAASQVVCWIGT